MWLFFGAMIALAAAFPWIAVRRYLPSVEPRDAEAIQARYERRYRRTLALRAATAVLFAYFLLRALTARGDDRAFRTVAIPGLLALIVVYLASFVGATLWRYAYDRAFVRAAPAFEGSVQPLTIRLGASRCSS